MNIRFIFILLLIILCFESIRAITPKQDTIILYHNEMITGELKEWQLGLLTVDTKNVGTINIKVSKVQSVNTSTDTFRIETADQMFYYGVLKPAPHEGFVYIVSPSYVRLIAISLINSMIPIQQSFGHRIQGNVSLGFNYTHSSKIGQLNTSSNINYTSKRIDLNLTCSGNATIDTTSFSTDRVDLGLMSYYNLKLNRKWYLVGQVDYQRNLQLSIARRYQETLGGGRKFILTPRTQILGMLGISLNQELSINDDKEDFLVEIPAGFVLNFFKFSNPNMQITSKNVFYTSLSQKGRVRYEMNTSIMWELIHNFNLSWIFYYSYDRKPPDPEAGKNDYGTTVGITYKF